MVTLEGHPDDLVVGADVEEDLGCRGQEGHDAHAGIFPDVQDPSFWTVVLLGLAGFGAGWIDAVVGGGGLIQLPALVLGLPGASPAQILATNKLGSVCGTTVSSVTYYRRVKPDLHTALPLMLVAFGGAVGGAFVATLIPKSAFNPLILAVLVIGVYDGALGPGTGSFFVFALVGLLGYSFLEASTKARMANWATNIAALAVFIPQGFVMWKIGLVMGACNVIGAYLGARTAVAKGAGFVRVIFIVVVTAFIVKIGSDVLRAWL